jgi:hypothetical protein
MTNLPNPPDICNIYPFDDNLFGKLLGGSHTAVTIRVTDILIKNALDNGGQAYETITGSYTVRRRKPGGWYSQSRWFHQPPG